MPEVTDSPGPLSRRSVDSWPFHIHVQTITHHSASPDFHGLGVAPAFLAVLEKRNVTVPTPIQAQSIPHAVTGKDIVGIAQTGTGKTFAFGIPMLQRLANGPGRGLVVVPTRELAIQVEESLAPFASAVGIRTAVLIGGESMNRQIGAIKRNPRIVIATPGRLNDHLEQKKITLREVSILVLDEADRMLDMGFRPQIEKILRNVPKERQTMLFSATMPSEIMRLAHEQMRLPLRIEVAPAGTTADKVRQELVIVEKREKTRALGMILGEHEGSVLVFSRTKHGAKKITRDLREMGFTAAEIHANRSLAQRKQALEGFKSGAYRVLVATDIAARGIDVPGIGLIVNYDLPNDPSDYVHRIGRTARAGREGLAISFATHDQKKDIQKIERLIRTNIRRRESPSGTREEFHPSSAPPQNARSHGVRASGRHHRPFRGRRGGGRTPRQSGNSGTRSA